MGKRQAFREINRINRKKTLNVTSEQLMGFILHQLAMHFSKKVNSSLTPDEYVSLWLGEALEVIDSGQIPHPEEEKQVINLLPKT